MIRHFILMLLLVQTSACTMQPPLPALPAERQVLVVLADDATGTPLPVGSKRGYRSERQWPVSLHVRAGARSLARDYRLTELYAWPIAGLELFCVVFEVPESLDRQTLLSRLGNDPRVTHAQPVNEFHGMIAGSYDDPLFEVQYGEHARALESVHQVTTGAGVRIGIVDGPVDTEHADLEGQIARQFPAEEVTDVDELRHGTAVAGVIAAAAGNGEGVVGLAPDATVTVYAGCRQTRHRVTRCTTVSLAEAIERAADDASDVINLSIAGPNDWLLRRLLKHAHEHGAVLVAANNLEEPDQSFPGSLPFVHVAEHDAGPWFARQEQFSTRAGGGYQVFFGSSISAAGVSGVAALLRSRRSGPETEAILDHVLGSGCLPVEQSNSPLELITAYEPCAP